MAFKLTGQAELRYPEATDMVSQLRTSLHIVLLVILAVIIQDYAHAASSRSETADNLAIQPVDIVDHAARTNITSHARYRLAHPGKGDDSPWQEPRNGSINLGFERSEVLVRLRLTNSSEQPVQRYLEIAHPLLDHIQAGFERLGNAPEDLSDSHTFNAMGDQLPFEQRSIEVRTFVYPITLAAAETVDLTFEIKSESSMQVPLWLSSQENFIRHSQLDLLQHAIYTGVMLAMLLYNFFVFISLKESVYLYYVLFVASALSLQLCLTGLWAAFAPPIVAGLQDRLIMLLVPAVVLTAALFTRRFLRLGQTAPRFDLVLRSVGLLAVALICISPFVVYSLFVPVAIALVVPTSICCLSVGPWLWRKGHSEARLYFFAWAGVMISVLIFICAKVGLIAGSYLAEHSPQFGSALEAMLLSFALAARLAEERRRRLESQEALVREARQRQLVESELYRQATRHHILDIPNRAKLDSWFRENSAAWPSLALCLIKFGRFREVNRTLGRRDADSVLESLAGRISQCLNGMPGLVSLGDALSDPCGNSPEPKDTLCSVEGATFAFLLENSTFINGSADVQLTSSSALVAVTTLVEELTQPFLSDEFSMELKATSGIAYYPEQAGTVEALLQKAQIALDAANSAAGSVVLYSASVNPYNERRLSLAGDLRQAIADNALTLAFQPKVTADSLRIDSVEALLRWSHPQYGYLPPDEFIPLAEETGLMRWLTDWVLDTALVNLIELRKSHPDLRMAVNFSAVNLREADFPARLKSTLSRHNLPASALILEITETAMMADAEFAYSVLNAIHDMGVCVSIDDFGTGYSSLSYIRRLPAREIKLDRSFVTDITASADDQAIARMTVSMAHALNMTIVAEGVETREAFDLLVAIGCDQLQGHYMSSPLPLDQLHQVLNAHNGYFCHPSLA